MGHTPGTLFTGFEGLGFCVIGNHSRQVCECYEDGEQQTEEDVANARLIAAAPDLLMALQEILDGNTMKARDKWNHAEVIQNHYQIARIAIAKATLS